MRKEVIKYVDFDGNERTEEAYFNLTKAELMELELGTEGGLSNLIKRITDTQDVPQLTKLFKKIILLSYGKKSDDGRRFIKSEELSKEFTETLAYDSFFMKFFEEAEFATNFVNSIIPQDMEKPKSSIPAPANNN